MLILLILTKMACMLQLSEYESLGSSERVAYSRWVTNTSRLSVAAVSRGPASKSLTCVLLAMTLVVGQAQEQNDPWGSLKDKTAWILLGLWDEQLNGWGTLLSHVPVDTSKPADGVPNLARRFE